jgi:hypothetical protein
VSDVSYGEPTLCVFGWNQGILEPRGYHILDPRATGKNAVPVAGISSGAKDG